MDCEIPLWPPKADLRWLKFLSTFESNAGGEQFLLRAIETAKDKSMFGSKPLTWKSRGPDLKFENQRARGLPFGILDAKESRFDFDFLSRDSLKKILSKVKGGNSNSIPVFVYKNIPMLFDALYDELVSIFSGGPIPPRWLVIQCFLGPKKRMIMATTVEEKILMEIATNYLISHFRSNNMLDPDIIAAMPDSTSIPILFERLKDKLINADDFVVKKIDLKKAFDSVDLNALFGIMERSKIDPIVQKNLPKLLPKDHRPDINQHCLLILPREQRSCDWISSIACFVVYYDWILCYAGNKRE